MAAVRRLALGARRVGRPGAADHRGAVPHVPGDAAHLAHGGDRDASAIDRDTRHTLHRLGEIGVGEVGDVFGKDRIDGAGGGAFHIERLFETLPITGDHHFFEFAAALG